MSFITLKWLLPKLIALKALSGAAVAVTHLVLKLYEAKQVISSHSSKPPSVGSTPEGSVQGETIKLELENLEEVGDHPDEDGLVY